MEKPGQSEEKDRRDGMEEPEEMEESVWDLPRPFTGEMEESE